MARRTNKFVVFLYALPVLCALACVAAGDSDLALLLVIAPAFGVLAALCIRATPVPGWTAPRRRRNTSALGRWQFRLRSMMALVTAAAVVFGLLTWSPPGALVVACLVVMLIGLVVDRLLEAVFPKGRQRRRTTFRPSMQNPRGTDRFGRP